MCWAAVARRRHAHECCHHREHRACHQVVLPLSCKAPTIRSDRRAARLYDLGLRSRPSTAIDQAAQGHPGAARWRLGSFRRTVDPSRGSGRSRPPTTPADERVARAVPSRGASRPKLAKMIVSQNTSITRNGMGIEPARAVTRSPRTRARSMAMLRASAGARAAPRSRLESGERVVEVIGDRRRH